MLGKSTKRVYDFIIKYSMVNGYSPTVREICVELGFKSTSSVTLHINNLVKEGLVRNAGSRGVILSGYTMISVRELLELKKKSIDYDNLLGEYE